METWLLWSVPLSLCCLGFKEALHTTLQETNILSLEFNGNDLPSDRKEIFSLVPGCVILILAQGPLDISFWSTVLLVEEEVCAGQVKLSRNGSGSAPGLDVSKALLL